jgi:hypothetical protein
MELYLLCQLLKFNKNLNRTANKTKDFQLLDFKNLQVELEYRWVK